MRLVLFLLGFAATLLAQGADQVIRISTSLVQIDAIVMDKNGNLVTDLQAQDFEIFQDARRRETTAFSLVRVSEPTSRQSSGAPKSPVIPDPRPARSGIPREKVNRTVAIVVDDLSVDLATMSSVRDAVTRFVNARLRDGDLAAIVTTSGGMGIYSQFTTDRALLATAAEMLGRSPRFGRAGDLGAGYAPLSDEVRVLQAGATSSLQSAIHGMREMPGRKSVVLISSGYNSGSVEDVMDGMADEATRAAVAVYAIDPGGVRTAMLGMDVPGRPCNPDDGSCTSRWLELNGPILDSASNWRRAMEIVTGRTGGLFFRNYNDIERLLARALDDQSSYYLLGYNPGSDSFDRKFHKIDVRVTRPGLTVRSRTGYVGVEERPQAPAESTVRRMVRSLLGPFQVNELHAQLNAAVRADPAGQKDGKRGLLVSRLWIDGRDLRYEKGEDGKFHTELEMAVATFDPKGAMRNHTEKAYKLNLSETELAEARRSGMLYSIYSQVDRPGPYHVRMAIRERGTEHVGTASQFVIAPDLSKNQLALSGLLVKGLAGREEDGFEPRPWLSLLSLGQGIEWEATAHRPKLKKGQPNLTAVTRLYRDRDLVQESQPVPLTASKGKYAVTLPVSGSVFLDAISAPGEYQLQLILTDHNDKGRIAAQTVVFQVAPAGR